MKPEVVVYNTYNTVVKINRRVVGRLIIVASDLNQVGLVVNAWANQAGWKPVPTWTAAKTEKRVYSLSPASLLAYPEPDSPGHSTKV